MALKRNSWLLAILIGFAMVGVLMFAYQAKANPSDFNVVKSAVATTTQVYIASGGNATTSAYDSFNGDPNASNSGVLFLQFTASSTSSVLGVTFQYSQDGIDWYGDDTGAATSTNINLVNTYSWTAAGTATTSKVITMPTPTRFVRAVYTMTGAAGGVWSSFVVKKETPE